MKTWAFYTTKGGMGKSTMTLAVASYLAYQQGLNTLVLDYDPNQYSVEAAREKELDWIRASPRGKGSLSEERLSGGGPLKTFGWTAAQIEAARHQTPFPITPVSRDYRLHHLVEKAEQQRREIVLIDGSSGFGENNPAPLEALLSRLDLLLVPLDSSVINIEGTVPFLEKVFALQAAGSLRANFRFYVYLTRQRPDNLARLDTLARLLSAGELTGGKPVSVLQTRIKQTVRMELGRQISTLTYRPEDIGIGSLVKEILSLK